MRAEDNLLEQRASQYRPKQYIGYDGYDVPFYMQNFPFFYYDCPEEVVVERIIPPFYCEQGKFNWFLVGFISPILMTYFYIKNNILKREFG